MFGIHTAGTKSEYTADVFTFNPEPAKANIQGIGRQKWEGSELTSHPTPKPIVLFDQLVRAFGQNAETICDPFMGTATTALAAHNLRKRFVGIEIEPRHFETACERIENAQRQLRMFA
jgi:DNA modification methylase